MNFYKNLPLFLGLAVLFFLVLFSSCRKDNNYFEGKASFTTDTDTLSFDTVFTKVGSTSKFIKIFNKEKQPILVDISLKNNNPQFRINVDGKPGKSFEKIEVPAEDSIYVFVETTVNPDQPLSISPFIIEDFLSIRNNGSEVNVLLIANGQNANYIPRVNGKGLISYLSCNLGKVNWNDEKPYVIYGILVIDSCELVLPPGARVYVHGGIAKNDQQYYSDGQIIVLKNGKISSNGSFDKQVTIQGDRLESDYKDVPGQWGGIRIFSGSRNNKFENTIIKNGIVGISLDSASSVSIKNSFIQNCSSYGIAANHSEVYGENLLIYGTGSFSLALDYGGKYEFNYCTFSSDINQDESILAKNFKCLDDLCQFAVPNPLKLNMTNCIITGGSEDELALSPLKIEELGTSKFDLKMENCIVRVKDILKEKAFPNFFDYCNNCYTLKSKDDLFIDKSKNDYRLDTMSVALDKGIPLNFINNDIKGKQRSSDKPDLGCFEF